MLFGQSSQVRARCAIRLMACFVGLVAGGVYGPAAMGQTFTTGFESPPFNGSAAGTTINGQDMWFTPAVAGSFDGFVLTYASNAYGLPMNTGGGTQFLGSRSAGGTGFSRAQREGITFSNITVVSYEAAAGTYAGTLPSAQNLGSFSLAPEPNPAAPSIRTYIQLNTWVDVATATAWNAGYLPYSATGVQAVQPGLFPGPEWQNLPLNNWFRFVTVIDFTLNRITEVSITNLTTGVTTTANPVDWFIGGGQTSTLPIPTGVRFFAGGAGGNTMGWDNLRVGPPVPECPCDVNDDGILNSQDFFDFLTPFFAQAPAGDFNGDGFVNSQDFFDFITCLFSGCL